MTWIPPLTATINTRGCPSQHFNTCASLGIPFALADSTVMVILDHRYYRSMDDFILEMAPTASPRVMAQTCRFYHILHLQVHVTTMRGVRFFLPPRVYQEFS